MFETFKTNDMVTDLRNICYQNTEHYRSDFELDAAVILEEAGKQENERSVLLWLSYPCGTRIMREPEVFLKDSPLYTTWLYYENTEECVVSAALEIHGMENGKVLGSICSLDYKEHCKRVRERAVNCSFAGYTFTDGTTVIGPASELSRHSASRNLKKVDWLPDEPERHEVVLFTEGCLRNGKREARAFGKKSVVSPHLVDTCNFMQLLEPRGENMRPVSEVCYARCDYDGFNWWTNWFLNGPKLQGSEAEEIDGFWISVFEREDFEDLESMKKLCRHAQPTSDPTEYNLFSETYNFYIWLRMITREGDYNLYIHYYRKQRGRLQ